MEARSDAPGENCILALTDSGEIVSFDLTDKDVDDASHVEPLLDQLADAPALFVTDGAYDRNAGHDNDNRHDRLRLLPIGTGARYYKVSDLVIVDN
jgi:hypothetical protein